MCARAHTRRGVQVKAFSQVQRKRGGEGERRETQASVVSAFLWPVEQCAYDRRLKEAVAAAALGTKATASVSRAEKRARAKGGVQASVRRGERDGSATAQETGTRRVSMRTKETKEGAEENKGREREKRRKRKEIKREREKETKGETPSLSLSLSLCASPSPLFHSTNCYTKHKGKHCATAPDSTSREPQSTRRQDSRRATTFASVTKKAFRVNR